MLNDLESLKAIAMGATQEGMLNNSKPDNWIAIDLFEHTFTPARVLEMLDRLQELENFKKAVESIST